MEIKNFLPIKHEGCPIYIRRLNDRTFEYLAVIRNEIYGLNMEFNPKDKLKGKEIYSKKELQDIMDYMQAAAKTTIETNLGIKKNNQTKK